MKDLLFTAIPKGQSLSDEVWSQRHRVIVGLLFAHAAGLFIFGVARGYNALHVAAEVSILVLFGMAARADRFSRIIRSVATTIGLLIASGLMVHLSGGVIETHFHFFVMVAVVSLYQDWTPFLLAIGFVVLHHGTVGVLDPEAVYNHAAAQQNPWGWAAIHGLFIAGESAVLLVGWRFMEDASNARTLMARRLWTSQRRFRNAFDNARSGMVLAGADNEITEVNVAFSDMLGYPLDEIPRTSLSSLIHPDDRDQVLEAICDVRNERKKVAHLEHRFIGRDGKAIWADVSLSLAQDEEDDTCYVVIQVQDITQRKKAEADKEVLESQLRQSQKMEAVGHLAGGVAHDFNNLLGVIGNYAAFVDQDVDPSSESKADLREIKAAVERGAQLTRQLLIFSRKEVVKPEVVDVSNTLQELKKILTRTLGEHIDLRIHTSDEHAHTLIDRGELEQVVMNLVVNARDAMPDGGSLTIAAETVLIDEAYAEVHPGVRPGEFICLTVSDSGTGMTPAVQSRIFEPFFTTKERGSGTGLGLATVYGIASRARGHVRVYSEPSVGTTFRVYLPRTDQPVSDSLNEVTHLSPAGGECILVVEDEESLRRVAVRILRQHGYKVLEAASGDDAVQLLREGAPVVDLLLTDIVMPGMSGRQLEEATGLPTLYMSGYTDDIVARNGVLGSDEMLLQKPFTAEDLVAKVQEALTIFKEKGTVGSGTTGRSVRVLVVDDDGPVTEVIRLVLQADDFKSVWLAQNGDQAVDLAKRIRPNIAVLDYVMPGEDGGAVAARLRQVVPDIKIVSFSAVLEETPVWADDSVSKVEIASLPAALRKLSPVA